MASWLLSFHQALRDVSRDAEDRAEAVDVALNTRIAELEDAKARLIEKDSMVSLNINGTQRDGGLCQGYMLVPSQSLNNVQRLICTYISLAENKFFFR